MKKCFFVAALLIIAVTVFSKTGRGFTVEYSRLSDSEMLLDFNVADFIVTTVEKGGISYSVIKGAGSVFTVDEGYAEIPYHATAVQLKEDRNVEMKYSFDGYEDIELKYPLLPSRGIISRSQKIDEIPYRIADGSVKNEWYPGKIAEITDPFIMRDVRGTNIIVYPYQYNFASKTLRIYKNLRISLIENDSEPVNPVTVKPKQVFPEMSGMYKSIFLNYNETKALPIGGHGEILVIYTPNNGGLAAIQPWIDWKRQKGFTVHTLEKPNGTDLYVTQDIKNQYLLNTNILYAQIVGDFPNLKSQVLNSVTSTTGAQDPMLGCTVGSDQYIDVLVGRFSVSSEAELTNQINKAINYEKNPTPSGTWYEKGLGIASNEGAGSGDDGEGDQAHSDIIINYKQLPFTYASVSTAYQANNVTKATILGYVNNGRSIINYTGHGSYDCFQSIYGGYLYDTDVATLTNGDMLPFVVSVACLVGNVEYASKPCFAESWLRKTNGGAVGGWFSSISQPWLPPMKAQDYYNDIIKGGYDYSSQPGDGINVTEQRTTVGTVCCNASNLMLQEAPTDAATKDTQEAWIIFGDVSLQLRTDPPKLLTVSNTSVTVGVPFTTNIKAAGSNFQNALVSLYQNGNTYAGFTDASGNVTISQSLVADAAKLTVTGFNTETKFLDITVSTGTTPPPTPTLLSPSNSGGTTDQTPTFEWSNVGGTSYTIQVDNNSNFSSPEVNQTVAAITYTPSSNLAYGTYYWRVLATNSYGSSSYSSAWTVNIGAAPGTPTLASPSNGSSTGDMTPTFDWNDVSGATSYTILVDNNSDFSSPEINQNPTSSTYTPSANLNYGTYYWKVLANNTYGPGSYSATWTVSVVEAAMSLPLYENFNAGTTLPAGWKIVDNQGNGQVWQFGTHTSGLSGADGNYAYLNSDAYGSGNSQNADLVTPLIDMTGATNITLAFSHYFRSYTGSSATLSYSINGGTNWTVIQSWSATSANPASFSQVIAAVANQPQVKFKWNYTGTWGYYWDIDNISITTETVSYPPVVSTQAANSVSVEEAVLNGTVNANGYSTTVTFEYGLTTSYGSSVAAVPGTVTGTSNTAVSANLTGLSENTTYNYRIKAVNSEGTSYGSNMTFKTESAPVLPDPPKELAAVANGANVSLSWEAPDFEEPDTFADSFEEYSDFALTFANWTQIDGDGGTAYGSTDADFTNESYIGSYIIFNPSQTTPALTGAWAPRTGSKYAACFAVLAASAPNNDWLITPQLLLGSGYSFSFYAKSIKMDWGADRFKVGISTTGTAQGDFTIISAGSYVESTASWAQYSYDLSAYAGQTVYLAITCVSNDSFVLAIDDISVNNAKGEPVFSQDFEEVEDNRVYGRSVYRGKEPPKADLESQPRTTRANLSGYKVYRNGSSIATIANPATLTYNDNGLSNGSYSYYVTATYTDPVTESGPSNAEEVEISASVIPGIPSNIVTSMAGSNIVIDWDDSADATNYDVYSSSDPNGTFTFEANVTTSQYSVEYSATKKFYYIVSKNATKDNTIKLETERPLK